MTITLIVPDGCSIFVDRISNNWKLQIGKNEKHEPRRLLLPPPITKESFGLPKFGGKCFRSIGNN